MLTLAPITQREAVAYVRAHHRHHEPPRGAKFSIAAVDGERVAGTRR